MKKLVTVLAIIIAGLVSFNANAQTAKVTMADLAGEWKFMGKATSSELEVKNSDFEYTFTKGGIVTYKSGAVKNYTVKNNLITITDKTPIVVYVHIEKFGNGEMTVITDYNTPEASLPIVFKKVK